MNVYRERTWRRVTVERAPTSQLPSIDNKIRSAPPDGELADQRNGRVNGMADGVLCQASGFRVV